MNKINFIVQTSTKSWSGGKDLAFNLVKNHPVVYWTTKRILDDNPAHHVIVCAPSFDQNQSFKNYFLKLDQQRLNFYFGYSKNPLKRIVKATDKFLSSAYIIRINSLHQYFHFSSALNMLDHAKQKNLDAITFPDDFPKFLTCEIFRVGAMRKALKILQSNSYDNDLSVHPHYFMFSLPSKFKTAYCFPLPRMSTKQLKKIRLYSKANYQSRAQVVNSSQIDPIGDQIIFHYQLALKYLKPKDIVLDIACSTGFGCNILSFKASQVTGIDLNLRVIKIAQQKFGNKVKFIQADALSLPFGNNSFSFITAMEIIEHIQDDQAFLKEIRRILKPKGLLVLSTPQNSLGDIPANPYHVREYSLKEIENLSKKYFSIQKIIGIKAGRIIIPNNPVGSNTMLILKK